MFSKIKTCVELVWERNYFKDGILTDTGDLTEEEIFLGNVITNKDNDATVVADISKRVIGYMFDDKLGYIRLENINLFNEVLEILQKVDIDVTLTTIDIDSETNPLQSIKLFNIGNGLIAQDFDIKVEVTNIVEEVYELTGLESDEARKKAKEFVATLEFPDNLSDDVIIDSFGDMNVLSSGAILKKGYDNIKVLEEIVKEINSRKGKIIEGKFTKCKTEECKSEWYKADFSKCKLRKLQS